MRQRPPRPRATTSLRTGRFPDGMHVNRDGGEMDWTNHPHIFDIKRFAIHDGPGIRTTVFMRGCELRCSWCHNPECRRLPQEADGASPERSAAEAMEIVQRDEIYYDQSGGGLTLSGGDPLHNPALLRSMLRLAGERGFHLALDTTGYAERDLIDDIAESVDLFLYDLKLMDDEAHRRHTGVPLGPILANLEHLARGGAAVVVRIPLIPGTTDTPENLAAIAEHLERLDTRIPVELLPFNAFSKAKYARLGESHDHAGAEVQSQSSLRAMRRIFLDRGLTVVGDES